MSTEKNKALVRRWWEEAFNARNLDVTDEVYAPSFVYEAPGFELAPGPEGVKEALRMQFSALPDTRLTVDELFAEGDKVVTRFTTRGMHTGEGGFFGIPPTGRRIATSGITISRLANGKIVEAWTQADALGMLQQMGVISAPASAPGAPSPAPPTPSGSRTAPGGSAASPEANKAVVRRYIDEVLSGGRFELMDELFAPDYTSDAFGQPMGRAEFQQALAAMRGAFSGLRVTVEDMVAEGDMVGVRFKTSGTHRAEFQGMPPTGKSYEVGGIVTYRLADGRIVEDRPIYDQLSMLQQLGAIPAPGQAG
jgi:steroid delta-isomerase-like uncharacterized protein